MAQGTLLNVTRQPGREGSFWENGYMHTYGRGPLPPPETITTFLTGYPPI